MAYCCPEWSGVVSILPPNASWEEWEEYLRPRNYLSDKERKQAEAQFHRKQKASKKK